MFYLNIIQGYTRRKAKPQYANTILTYSRLLHAMNFLRYLVQKRRSFIKVAQKNNRNTGQKALHEWLQWAKARRMRQNRLRWARLNFLRDHGTYLLKYWFNLTKKNLPRRRFDRKIKTWHHIKWLCRKKFMDWLKISRKHRRLRIVNRFIHFRHAQILRCFQVIQHRHKIRKNNILRVYYGKNDN